MAELPDSYFAAEFGRRARREEHFRREREGQKHRREEQEDQAEAADFAEIVIIASAMQRAELANQIALYETATVQALLENEQQQKFAREQLQNVLGHAHVLPDGRRVFKTEDGQEVYDEGGNNLNQDEADPDLIGDEKPTWETYKHHKAKVEGLDDERQKMIEYQGKLDEARERLEDDDLTQSDLENLKGELDDLMPASVRRELPDNGQAQSHEVAPSGGIEIHVTHEQADDAPEVQNPAGPSEPLSPS